MLLKEAKEILEKNGYNLFEDTDEYDDADLGINVDKKAYHAQKKKMRSLKDRVIAIWDEYVNELATTADEGNWERHGKETRDGTNEEQTLMSRYEVYWNKPFKHSNKIDIYEFYKCLLVAWSAVDVKFDKKLALKLNNDVFYELFEYEDEVEEALRKNTLTEYLNTKFKLKLDKKDEKWLQMAWHLYDISNGDSDDGIIVYCMGDANRQQVYKMFMKCMSKSQIYRLIDIDLSGDANHKELNKWVKDGKISQAQADHYKYSDKYFDMRELGMVNLKYPGKSWSWSKDGWSGNMMLIAENQPENRDLTMSALCLGKWSEVYLDKIEGEMEVRVLDETEVTILDVISRENNKHLQRKDTYYRQ